MDQKAPAVKLIRAAIDLGFSTSEAVQKALGRPLSHFAEERGHRPSEVSMCLNGYPGRTYALIRDHLAAELGIERRHLDVLIDGEPEPAEAA